MDLLKQVNSFIILVLLCISIYFVWDRYIKVKDNQIEVIQYLDSIAKVRNTPPMKLNDASIIRSAVSFFLIFSYFNWVII